MSFDDRIKGPLSRFIDQVTAGVDYFGLYISKVVQQNTDLTLELHPDDPKVPDHSNVPINHGIPGMTVKVAAGARVLLGFVNGDPTQPYAALWESASVTELVLNGTTVKVGADDATEAAIHGDALKSYLDTLVTSLTTFATGLNSGTLVAQGAALVTALGAPLTALGNYRSTVVKVK